MMTAASPPTFHAIGGAAVRRVLAGRHSQLVALVEQTYRSHADGNTVNPDSYFLRFPEKPGARIIALPAYLGPPSDLAGLKWISSFPGNVATNLARASAVIILNDGQTGYPVACLEGSVISAARTAASAALAARLLHPNAPAAETMAVIGAGPIARMILTFLLETGWSIGRFVLFDLNPASAGHLAADLRDRYGVAVSIAPEARTALCEADLILLATTAPRPYLEEISWFPRPATVLNISLRDLGVEVILSAQNVVDDIEHCLKADTSPHLTEQRVGHRRFIAGTVADLCRGKLTPQPDRLRIFSPFGLGVLDLAVAQYVYDEAVRTGEAVALDGFFADSRRW